MKIVHITHAYIDHYAYQDNELPEAQARLGHDVTVISTQDYAGCFDYQTPDMPGRDSYYIDSCKIVRLPLRFKVNYRLAAYKGLYRQLTIERPDLIFFHEIPYFCLWDIVRYIRRNKNCKLFVDYHCDIYNSGNNWMSRLLLHKVLYRAITYLTDKYVAIRYVVTPGTKDFIMDMYNVKAAKIKLLPLGGDLEKMNIGSADQIRRDIREKLNISSGEILVVTAGKLNRNKKVDVLIRAFQMLTYVCPVKLLIIGSIEEKEYEKELNSLAGNNPDIFFLGWQQSAEIYKYFLASDLACFPGSQSVLWQQAICCGLPLVCRYWDGADYLNIADNVLFFKEDSPQVLKDILEVMVSSPALLEKMKSDAETKAREYFSYKRIAQSIIEDYHSL